MVKVSSFRFSRVVYKIINNNNMVLSLVAMDQGRLEYIPVPGESHREVIGT